MPLRAVGATSISIIMSRRRLRPKRERKRNARGATSQARRRTTFGPSSIRSWTSERSHSLGEVEAVMKTFAVTGMSALLAIVVAQDRTVLPNNGPKTESVVDAAGNLHVPAGYRTAYQSLGSWAVTADQGSGSKELHVVYASP